MPTSPPQNHPAYRRAELKKLIRSYVTDAQPAKMPLGLLKVSMVAASAVYVGGLLAKNGAAFLEENEIFVPAEGDDAFE